MDWPLILPDGLTLRLITKSQMFEGPLTTKVETSSVPGDRWAGTLTYTNRSGAEGNILKMAVRQIRGRAGRVQIPMFEQLETAGTALGTPVVDGADQTGNTLDTTGWTASQAKVLAAGDFFSVNGEVKQITADVASDGSGNATLSFVPALRTAPADSAPLTVDTPRINCMIDTDGLDVQTSSPIIYSLTVPFVEVI